MRMNEIQCAIGGGARREGARDFDSHFRHGGMGGDRQGGAPRGEILGAARRVFAERGFRGTTIADIADEAGIALGTIYLYFPSKEAVFAALSQRFSELITTASTDLPRVSSVEGWVRESVGRVFDTCRENRDLVRLVVINSDPGTEIEKGIKAADETRNRPLALAVARAMKSGRVRDGDPAIVARMIRGVVSIAVYQAFVLANGEDADKYRDVCVEMIIAYLRPTAGGTTS